MVGSPPEVVEVVGLSVGVVDAVVDDGVGSGVVVVGTGPLDVVTTSCGLFAVASRLANLTRPARSVATTRATSPLPVTAGVTSTETVVLTTRFFAVPTAAPGAGAIAHVIPGSVQPVPVGDTVMPLAQVEYVQSLSVAEVTVPVSPLTANLRYARSSGVVDDAAWVLSW